MPLLRGKSTYPGCSDSRSHLSWLAAIVQRESALITRRALLHSVVSLDLADDKRHYMATAEAWTHLAEKGHRSKPAEDGSLHSHYVELFQADMASEARIARIRKDFQAETGHEGRLSAFDMVQLLSLYVKGKQQAWDAAMPAPTPAPPAVAQTHQTDTPVDSPTVPGEDPSLMAIARSLNAFKRVEGVEEKTLAHFESSISLFIRLTGVSDVREIHQSTLTAYRADLAKLPKSWGKSPKDADATRNQIMERSANLPTAEIGLSAGTTNRHLDNIKQLLTWAQEQGLNTDTRINTKRLRKKSEVRDRDKRTAITREALEKLFQSAIWQGSRSHTLLLEPGSKIYRNGVYWSVLLLAYSGARRSEITGLQVDEIITREGLLCVDIKPNDLRRLKNSPSKRVLPIHSHILELGFMAYVEQAPKSGQKALFPDLIRGDEGERARRTPIPKDDNEGSECGVYLTKRMRTVFDTVLGKEEGGKYSLHSIRH